MAILFERTIRNRDMEYRVVTDLDDAAMMDDQVRLTIQGSVRRLPNGKWLEETVDLVVEIGRAVVEIRVSGRLIATVPLSLPLADAVDFLGNDVDVAADDSIIEGAIGISGIEEIIQLFPTDPFLGCIVKGAVSTSVGQIIRCWRRTPSEMSVVQRVRNIGGCLREYALRMALTFMYRAGRCMVLAGLG